MLINRITSVVAAILVVICLLVTNILGLSLKPKNFVDSSRFMHYNSNNDIWLALTSTLGVRQPRFYTEDTMSASQFTLTLKRQDVIFRDQHKGDPHTDETNLSKNLRITQGISSEESKYRLTNDYHVTNRIDMIGSSHLSMPLPSQTTSPPKTFKRSNVARYDWHSHNEPLNSNPVSASTSTSRISQIHKRDISDALLNELDYDSRPVVLHNRCSKGNVYLNFSGRFNAYPRKNHDTHFKLLKSKYEGFGIFSIEQKQFMCFDPTLGQAVPKTCFDWCLCSFQEKIMNGYFVYELVSKPQWKLSFDRRGESIDFKSPTYKMKRNLKCRNFVKVNYEGDVFNKMSPKFAEDLSCDWEKTGQQIFDEQLRQNPRYECILSHHPDLIDSSKPKVSIGSKSEPVSFSSTILANTSHNTALVTTFASKDHSKTWKLYRNNRCTTKSRRAVNLSKKVRHLSKKARLYRC